MKKLSLLMALAMLITIGGVYATWSYSEGVMYTKVHEHFTISIAGAVSEDAKGVITVDTSGLSILIDNDGNYVPEMTISGAIKVYFKPATGVNDDVAAGDIDLKFSFSASRGGTQLPNVADTIEYQFEGEDPIKVFSKYDQDEHDVNTADRTWDGEKGAWCYVIPWDTIDDLIVLNTAGFEGEKALKSFAEFQAFETAINSQSYGISVWEPTA